MADDTAQRQLSEEGPQDAIAQKKLVKAFMAGLKTVTGCDWHIPQNGAAKTVVLKLKENSGAKDIAEQFVAAWNMACIDLLGRDFEDTACFIPASSWGEGSTKRAPHIELNLSNLMAGYARIVRENPPEFVNEDNYATAVQTLISDALSSYPTKQKSKKLTKAEALHDTAHPIIKASIEDFFDDVKKAMPSASLSEIAAPSHVSPVGETPAAVVRTEQMDARHSVQTLK